MLRVLQAEDLDPEPAAWLAQRCSLTHCHFSDSPRFLHLLRDAHALIVRTYCRVDAHLLDLAPHLKVIGRAGVGLDHIDLLACRNRNIAVVHTPDANSQAVVEFVLALLLDALRPRTSLAAPLQLHDWNRLRRSLLAPRELAQLTLSILGLGRIGSRLARAAAALGMRTLFHDLRSIPLDQRHGATFVPLDQLLREADVLSLHVDGRPSNRHLLAAPALALLKPDVTIVNAARGFLVDPHALADFLRAHPNAHALLDVHDPEPFDADYPLLHLPNASLTPHLAASTATAHLNMSWVVRDVWRVLSGEPPLFPAPTEHFT